KILAEVNDINERILRFEQGDYQAIFDRFNKVTNDERVINRILDKYKEQESKLEKLLDEFSISENIFQEFSEESRKELTTLIDENNSEYELILEKLDNIKEDFNKLVISFEEKIENSNWNKLFKDAETEKKDLEERLREQDLTNFQNMENLHQKLKEKNIELENISNDKEELENLKVKLSNNLEEYQELRENKTTLRREFLNNVMSDENDVKIEVRPYRDSLSFENILRKILQRSEGFIDDFQKI